MGVWGAGIYENDSALDIHSYLVRLLKEDTPLKTALTKVIEKYEGLYFVDVIFGIAKEQIRYDVVVNEDLLKQAWFICEHREEEILRWTVGRGEEDGMKRSKVLDEFQKEIEKFVFMNEEDISDKLFIGKIESRLSKG